MKVIFLDFDGVLNGSHDLYDNGIKVPEEIYKERLEKRIKILGEICKENDSKIVIESSYKSCIDEETLETNVEWIQDIFILMKKFGVEVIGRTPELSSFKEDYNGNPPIWKEDEILEYLNRHPEIDGFCVLDDDDLGAMNKKSDLEKVDDHLVITKWIDINPEEEGLLERHKPEIKKILNKPIGRIL